MIHCSRAGLTRVPDRTPWHSCSRCFIPVGVSLKVRRLRGAKNQLTRRGSDSAHMKHVCEVKVLNIKVWLISDKVR